MKVSAVLVLTMCLVSCVRNIEQAKIEAYKDVSTDCEEIKGKGDIFELLRLVGNDTRSVISLLNRKPTHDLEEKVHAYAKEISKNSALVIELSRGEWNTPDVRHKIVWTMSDKDFGSRNLYVWDPEIKQVYLSGLERPDLVSKFVVDQNGNDFVIEYVNSGTSLEYCQLNSTLMVALEIKSGSFKKPKMKYFNLYVNLEK